MNKDWTFESCNIFNKGKPESKVKPKEATLIENNCNCCFVSESEPKLPVIPDPKPSCCKKQFAIYMYCENTVYDENDWVVKDGIFYKSLINENGNSIPNALYWKKVDLANALFDIDPSENGKFVNGKLSMPIGTILLVPKNDKNKANLSGFIDLDSGKPIPKCYTDLIAAVGETFPEPPGVTDHELPVGSLVLHLANDSSLGSVLGDSLQAGGWSTLKTTTTLKNSPLYLLLNKTNPSLLNETSPNVYKLDPTLGSRENNIFPRIVTNNDHEIATYTEQSTLDLTNSIPYLYLPPVVLSYKDLPTKEAAKAGVKYDFKHILGRDPTKGKLLDSTIAEDSGVRSSYVLLGDRVDFYAQQTDYFVDYDSTFNYSKVKIFHQNDTYTQYLGDKISPDSVGFNLLIKNSSTNVNLLENYKYVILAFNKMNQPYLDIDQIIKDIEDSVRGDITDIQTVLETMCGKIKQVDAKVDTNAEKIQANTDKININTQDIKNLDTRVTVNTESISNVKNTLNSFAADLDVIRNEIEEEDDKIDKLQDTTKQLEDKIKSLTAEIELLKTLASERKDMSPDCEEKINQLTTKLSELKTQLDQNTADIRELKTKPSLDSLADASGSVLTIKETDSTGFIPSDFIGKNNDFLLCTPDKLINITIGGVNYSIPAYLRKG